VLHTYWLGDVSLALDKRRQPPAPLAALRRAGIEVVR
jgi:hypothetical protein